jgi:hypothetical protein
MTAAIVDIDIEQGATRTVEMVWKDSLGTPVNLTNYAARMHLRKSLTATGDPLDALTSQNGRIVVGGSNGKLTLKFPATVTSGYTFATAVYDLEVEALDGTVTRLIQGNIVVSKEVTR